MVFRVYVEKKREFAHEAASLLQDAKGLLGIAGLTGVRVVNRYDAENITRELFDYAVRTVFSEPQTDLSSTVSSSSTSASNSASGKREVVNRTRETGSQPSRQSWESGLTNFPKPAVSGSKSVRRVRRTS